MASEVIRNGYKTNRDSLEKVIREGEALMLEAMIEQMDSGLIPSAKGVDLEKIHSGDIAPGVEYAKAILRSNIERLRL